MCHACESDREMGIGCCGCEFATSGMETRIRVIGGQDTLVCIYLIGVSSLWHFLGHAIERSLFGFVS